MGILQNVSTEGIQREPTTSIQRPCNDVVGLKGDHFEDDKSCEEKYIGSCRSISANTVIPLLKG